MVGFNDVDDETSFLNLTTNFVMMILSRPTDRTRWLKKYLRIRKNSNEIIIIRNID